MSEPARRVLLDTNAIIWAVGSPATLTRRARAAIDAAEIIVVSVISYWEVMLKAGKGTLLIEDPVAWWRLTCDALAVDETLQLRIGHVTRLREIPRHHKDPFDRMLVAQAVEEGLPIISSDAELRKYPVEVIW